MAAVFANLDSVGAALDRSRGRKEVLDSVVSQLGNLSPIERLYLYLSLPTKRTGCKSDPANTFAFPRPAADEAQRWMLTHLEEKSDSLLTRSPVYDNYREYCQVHDMKPVGREEFGKIINNTFPNVGSRRVSQQGQMKHCYSGLAVRSCLDKPQVPAVNKPDLTCPTQFEGSKASVKDVTELTKAACFVIQQWAQALLQVQFDNIFMLARYLVEQGYVNAETTAALTVLTLAPVSKLVSKANSPPPATSSSSSSAAVTNESDASNDSFTLPSADTARAQIRTRLEEKQKMAEQQAVIQQRLKDMAVSCKQETIPSPEGAAVEPKTEPVDQVCSSAPPLLTTTTPLFSTPTMLGGAANNILLLPQLQTGGVTVSTATAPTQTILPILTNIVQPGAVDLQQLLLPLANFGMVEGLNTLNVGGSLLLPAAQSTNQSSAATTNQFAWETTQTANQMTSLLNCITSVANNNAEVKTVSSQATSAMETEEVVKSEPSIVISSQGSLDSMWDKLASCTATTTMSKADSVLAQLLNAPQSPDGRTDVVTTNIKPILCTSTAQNAAKRSGGKTVSLLLEENRVYNPTVDALQKKTFTDSRPVCQLLKERRRHRSQQSYLQNPSDTKSADPPRLGRRRPAMRKCNKEPRSAPATPVSAVLDYFSEGSSPQVSPAPSQKQQFFPASQLGAVSASTGGVRLPIIKSQDRFSHVHPGVSSSQERSSAQSSMHPSGKGKSVSFRDTPMHIETFPREHEGQGQFYQQQQQQPEWQPSSSQQMFYDQSWAAETGASNLQQVPAPWQPSSDPFLGQQPTKPWGSPGDSVPNSFVPIDNVASSAGVAPVRPLPISAPSSNSAAYSQDYGRASDALNTSWEGPGLMQQSGFIPYTGLKGSVGELSDSGISSISAVQSPVASGFASMENIRPVGKRNSDAEHREWHAKRQRHHSDQSGLRRGKSQLEALLTCEEPMPLGKTTSMTPLTMPQSPFSSEVHSIMSAGQSPYTQGQGGGLWPQGGGGGIEFRSQSVPALNQQWNTRLMQGDQTRSGELMIALQEDSKSKDNLTDLMEIIQNDEPASMHMDTTPPTQQTSYWNPSYSGTPWGSGYAPSTDRDPVFSPGIEAPSAGDFCSTQPQVSSSLLLPYNSSLSCNDSSASTFTSALLP